MYCTIPLTLQLKSHSVKFIQIPLAFSVLHNFYEQYISHYELLFSIMSKIMKDTNIEFRLSLNEC